MVHCTMKRESINQGLPPAIQDQPRVRILVVDDHVGFARGLRRYLVAQPPVELVGTVTEGSLVLEQVTLTEPDLVIMDAEMSGPGGLAITRAIRAAGRKVRVVLTSLHEDPEHHAAAIAAGAEALLAKSRIGEELLPLLENCSLGVCQ